MDVPNHDQLIAPATITLRDGLIRKRRVQGIRITVGRGDEPRDIADHPDWRPSGVTWTVYAERRNGRPELVYLSKEAYGGATLAGGPNLSERYLAVIALARQEQLAATGKLVIENRAIPAWGVEVRRPDDALLLEVIRSALDQQLSARQTLADAFGASVNTADDWIAYARRIPDANLPPARRGRTPGHKNLKPKRDGGQS